MYGPSEFEGGVFHETIPGGRASAAIQLTAGGVSALTSTNQRFEVRYSDCVLDVGGASGRMVFVRTTDRTLTIFCEDRQFPKALEMDAGPELAEQLTMVTRSRWAEGFRWRMWLFIGTTAFLLFLVGVYYGLLFAAKASVATLPLDVDKKLGQMAFDSMDIAGPKITDPVVVGAIQDIVSRLQPHADLPGLTFDVHVVNSKEVNAYCLPGGKIVIFTGLLRRAASPEQVAGVLSHEMSHATKRHGLRRAVESIGVFSAIRILTGDVGWLESMGIDFARQAALSGYSRAAETEADVAGVQMLHAAAIDPLELAAFFELLKAEEPGAAVNIKWLGTHPDHDARIAQVRSELAKLSPQQYRALDIDWQNVQQRLHEIGAE